MTNHLERITSGASFQKGNDNDKRVFKWQKDSNSLCFTSKGTSDVAIRVILQDCYRWIKEIIIIVIIIIIIIITCCYL